MKDRYARIEVRVSKPLHTYLKTRSPNGNANKIAKEILNKDYLRIKLPDMVETSKDFIRLTYKKMNTKDVKEYINLEYKVILKYAKAFVQSNQGKSINGSLDSLFSFVEDIYRNEIKTKTSMQYTLYTWEHDLGSNFSNIYCKVLKKFICDDIKLNAAIVGTQKEIIIKILK